MRELDPAHWEWVHGPPPSVRVVAGNPARDRRNMDLGRYPGDLREMKRCSWGWKTQQRRESLAGKRPVRRSC